MSRAGFTLPIVFGTKTVKGPLSDLDSDFNPLKNAILDSGNGWVNWSTVGGTVNAITLTNTPPCLTLNTGATFVFRVTSPNTGATTINVDGLGAQSVVNSVGAALTGGELSNLVTVIYVAGTGFYVVSNVSAPGRFNAISNPNFEVDQRQCHANVGFGAGTAAAFIADRWQMNKAAATGGINTSSYSAGTSPILIPGTNFAISDYYFTASVATQQASLAAGDYAFLQQVVEGPMLRELIGDVTSTSLLVFSTVAGLKFGVAFRDIATTQTLTKLVTVPTANTWTLITLPNLPKWPSGATWALTPGSAGYYFHICLAAGSTNTSPANDTWQSGSFLGAAGQGNFFANSVGSTLSIAFVQHEPGPLCTSLIDKPFDQNYRECLRYYQKSYPYGTAVGATSVNGYIVVPTSQNATSLYCNVPFLTPMAKAAVSLGIYSFDGGAANKVSLRNNIGTVGGDLAVTAASWSEKNIGIFTCSAIGAAYTSGLFHYTADTGW